MTRRASRIGRMRDVESAGKQWVARVSCTRKPRHMDRAFVALADLSLKYGPNSFPKEEVIGTVNKHATCEDSNASGKLIKLFVEITLSNMVDGGYIALSDCGEMIRITPEFAKLKRKIDRCLKATQFATRRQKLYAHCDHFRQRVGTSTTTKKQSNARVAELEDRWARHCRHCTIARQDSVFSDTTSMAFDTPISSNGAHDVDMYEEPEHPIPGPSSMPLTPPRRTASMTPDSAYLTPVSLPPSPTQGRSSFRLPEMEVDEPVTAGPSSVPMTVTNATPARNPTFTGPAVAYPTPASLPRRQEGTRGTLSPPPSPTLRRSFSHVRDAEHGMDVDQNPSSSSNTVPPAGMLGRCFETISKFIPFSILGLPSEPSPDTFTRGIELHHVAGDAARLSMVRSNERYQAQHRELEEQIQLLQQQLKTKDANEEEMTQQINVLRQNAAAGIISAQNRHDEQDRTLRALELKLQEVVNKLYHSELWRKAAANDTSSLRSKNRLLQDQNCTAARESANEIRKLQAERKEVEDLAKQHELEKRVWEAELKQAKEELDIRLQQRQRILKLAADLGATAQE